MTSNASRVSLKLMALLSASLLAFTSGQVAAQEKEPATKDQTNAPVAQASQEKQPAAANNQAQDPAAQDRPINEFVQTKDASGGVGVGLILGEPTGLSVKGWLSDKTAVVAGAGWAFENPDAFHLHGDFVYHLFDLLPVPKGRLPVYFGAGARLKFERRRDTVCGIRAPLGVAYLFENAPVDLFAEIVPVIDVSPRSRLEMNGGVGFRYFFR